MVANVAAPLIARRPGGVDSATLNPHGRSGWCPLVAAIYVPPSVTYCLCSLKSKPRVPLLAVVAMYPHVCCPGKVGLNVVAPPGCGQEQPSMSAVDVPRPSPQS